MERVVVFAVMEFIVDAAAHFKVVVGCYGSITGIEKPILTETFILNSSARANLPNLRISYCRCLTATFSLIDKA